MEGGVEHDDCECQHETSVDVAEHGWIKAAVMAGELFHHSVDFLRFTGQPKTPHELSAFINNYLLLTYFINLITFINLFINLIYFINYLQRMCNKDKTPHELSAKNVQ